jgi:hypothetical protein
MNGGCDFFNRKGRQGFSNGAKQFVYEKRFSTWADHTVSQN